MKKKQTMSFWFIEVRGSGIHYWDKIIHVMSIKWIAYNRSADL